MARYAGADAIYEVADLYRQRCLVERRSLLWPDADAWSPDNVSQLYSAFIDHPDDSNRSFFEKWHDQLADQPAAVHYIATDVVAFYFLFPTDVGRAKKLEGVREVVGWKIGSDPADLHLLEEAFSTGIGRAGIHY